MELWVSPISGRTSARSESRGLKHRAGSDAQEGGDTASGKARTLHGGVADQRTRQHDGPSAGVGGDLGDPQIVARGDVGERGVHKRGGIDGTGEDRRGGGGDDRSDEFAAPENTFIKGPTLASTAQPSQMLPETETASQPTAVEIGGRLSERVSDERAIQTPGRPDGGGKLAQDKIRILPGARD